MKLSVIIPAYNEKDTILKVIEKVEKVPIDKEIIVVDDGSTDGTRELLSKLKKEKPYIKIIFHEANKGKGGAVKTGISHATGDVVIIQDADLEYDPDDYPSLLKPIEEGRTDVVFGSRLLKKDNPKGSVLFYMGRYSLSLIFNLLFGTKLTDVYTCYKVFKREVMEKIDIESRSFELEAELASKTVLMGKEIIEVPIRYYPRDVEEGKKINWKDWFRGVKAIIKYRLKGSKALQ